jgi:chemotaxis protein methyltransferase CheR
MDGNPVLSDKEYDAFVKLIYRSSGINLGDNKKELLKTRFQKIIRKLSFSSYQQYYDHIVNDKGGEAFCEMIDAISTNHTYFYREGQHFDFLREKALPYIFQRKKEKRNNRLRAWCAASSSGEEPYTLVFSILESLDQPDFDIKLLATDISTKVLRKAVAGRYHLNQFREMPRQFLSKYFEPDTSSDGQWYRVNDDVRQYVVFRRFNLMTPHFPFKKKFDFIFCRNVMIYFDVETQQKLVEKMIHYLDPGGFLFIGHSENITGPVRAKLKQLAPAIFQKI